MLVTEAEVVPVPHCRVYNTPLPWVSLEGQVNSASDLQTSEMPWHLPKTLYPCAHHSSAMRSIQREAGRTASESVRSKSVFLFKLFQMTLEEYLNLRTLPGTLPMTGLTARLQSCSSISPIRIAVCSGILSIQLLTYFEMFYRFIGLQQKNGWSYAN